MRERQGLSENGRNESDSGSVTVTVEASAGESGELARERMIARVWESWLGNRALFSLTLTLAPHAHSCPSVTRLILPPLTLTQASLSLTLTSHSHTCCSLLPHSPLVRMSK